MTASYKDMATYLASLPNDQLQNESQKLGGQADKVAAVQKRIQHPAA